MSKFLGLISGKQFNDESWHTRNNRRRIFHEYPTGKFPLTGFLSTMETDWSSSSEFGWHEKNLAEFESTIAAGTNAPFATAGSETAKSNPFSVVKGDSLRVYVADKSCFRKNMLVRFIGVPVTGGTATLFGVVSSVVSAVEAIEIAVIEDLANIVNNQNAPTAGTPGPVGCVAEMLGSAYAEGARSGSGQFVAPFKIENYAQIFRNAFSITGSALKSPADWDKTGIYKEKAHDNIVAHMIGMEKAFLFGRKTIRYEIDDDEEVPIRTTGGIEWFLEQYEAANSVYRGGTGAPAQTTNADDDKRIINADANGKLDPDFFWGDLMERMFRYQGDKTHQKLCICGSGFVGAINQNVKGNVTVNKNMTAEAEYGFAVHTVETPHGSFELATHPLFNRNARYRYDAFFLDIHDIKFRPVKDRDTRLYKARQHNDQDRRKDEWLTEAGLEFRHPQRHTIIRGLKSISA